MLITVTVGCTTSGDPTAFAVGSVPTTGTLSPPGTSFHICTASVVSSPTQDLIITAAHCVFGSAVGYTFVPGSVNGSAPKGRWTVTAAYVDPAWKATRNPLRDVAILRVAPEHIGGALHKVQQVTGGNRLITTPAKLGPLVVPAYAAGIGGSPIACIAETYRHGSYTAFDCGGYLDGVSGGPFIQGSTVLGVIGGLNQGGCLASTSYSSPFDATTLTTFNRAVSQAKADVLPGPAADGC